MSMLSGVMTGASQALFGVEDIKRGKVIDDTETDYTHLLPKYYRKKLELVVEIKPENMDSDTLTAFVSPKIRLDKFGRRDLSGSVRGVLRPNGHRRELLIEEAHLTQGLRGKGIGKAMYEALYREAHELGATHVKGGVHSSNAENVHRSLAAKHGWRYDASPNTTDEGGDWPPESWEGDEDTSSSWGSRDDRWQRYEFELNGIKR